MKLASRLIRYLISREGVHPHNQLQTGPQVHPVRFHLRFLYDADNRPSNANSMVMLPIQRFRCNRRQRFHRRQRPPRLRDQPAFRATGVQSSPSEKRTASTFHVLLHGDLCVDCIDAGDAHHIRYPILFHPEREY